MDGVTVMTMWVPRLSIIIQMIITAKAGERRPSPSIPSPAAAMPSIAILTSPIKLRDARTNIIIKPGASLGTSRKPLSSSDSRNISLK